MNRPTNTRSEERHEFPKLEADHGEDPARFLQSGRDLALARIRGLEDVELLAAYRAVAKQILRGRTREAILTALAEREAALTDDPTPTPVAATDGGVVEPDPADATSDADGDPAPEPEPDAAPVHPDATGLEPGQVLVVERPDATEFIFPATVDAPKPFVCSRDGEAEPLSKTDAFSRLQYDPERQPVDEIDVDAPALAATNGGADQ